MFASVCLTISIILMLMGVASLIFKWDNILAGFNLLSESEKQRRGYDRGKLSFWCSIICIILAIVLFLIWFFVLKA